MQILQRRSFSIQLVLRPMASDYRYELAPCEYVWATQRYIRTSFSRDTNPPGVFFKFYVKSSKYDFNVAWLADTDEINNYQLL